VGGCAAVQRALEGFFRRGGLRAGEENGRRSGE
jgi:hypothetical protein